MQTSILNSMKGLDELLNAMAPLRDVGVRKLNGTRFPDTLPKFNLSCAMNTAPARLINDGLFNGLQLRLSSAGGTSSLSATSELSGNKPSVFPIFNRTYTLEDQVRHKNFLEDAASTFTKKVEVCAFCKRNGSPFFNHPLKDSRGGTVCPVLSRFTCKMCAATGRDAHTHKYCKNNPYTRGDPVSVGMAPGPSIKNPTKTPVKVDPSIDLNDIYGVKKFTQSFKPVKRLDSTRALLFDENLRTNKKMKDVTAGRIHKILQEKSRNEEKVDYPVGYNSINNYSGKRRDSQNLKPNRFSYQEFDLETNFNQQWLDFYNQGLDSSLGQTSYASILRNSPPKSLEKPAAEIYALPTSKKNSSKRVRRNWNKKSMELNKTSGTVSLGKELQALQKKVNKGAVTSPFWY